MIGILTTIIGKHAAELVAPAIPYIIGAALIALAFTLGRCDGVSDERARHALATSKANEKATTRDAGAKETASEERATDKAAIDAKQKEQVDAIQGDNDAAVRINAACQRLRAAGRSEAALPAACRSGS
ncbi:hypothetical protein [Sphingomonas sp.]|uniref:hypothetical protein n=1 Tax=Sphingomonas sp. TaxID=28214 RepID=UPI003BA84FA7